MRGGVLALLILSAFPAELDALLREADVDRSATHEDRTFYIGRLGGHDVVMALTGIGLENALWTTAVALRRFDAGGVVFCGVSGGRSFIGDVTVPDRWTMDGGTTWFAVDPEMLETARAVAGTVELERTVPNTATLEHPPTVIVGGDGYSADPFGGRRLPCVPGGGDVFGCEPSLAPGAAAPPTGGPAIDTDFFLEYFGEVPEFSEESHAADDMESGATARVAADHGLPFIAFRGLSDGQGDPLGLPGFPAQFFVYKDLAAGNAAKLTLAFLRARTTR